MHSELKENQAINLVLPEASQGKRKFGKFLKIFSCLSHLFLHLLMKVFYFVTGFMRMWYSLEHWLSSLNKIGIEDGRISFKLSSLFFPLHTGR